MREAAIKAEELRNAAINAHKDFTFETVLSTDRNLKLLQRAKDEGYFIRTIYVLTAMPEVNIMGLIWVLRGHIWRVHCSVVPTGASRTKPHYKRDCRI